MAIKLWHIILSALLFFIVPSLSIAQSGDATLSNFENLSDKIILEEIYPGAASMGAAQGDPIAAKAFDTSGDHIGYVFVNTDYLPTIGYSGKPIHMAIGMDLEGKIKGAKLLKHSEPIILIGIPESKITAYIDGYIGLDAIEIANASDESSLPVDIVSGATVTIIIIDDAIKRSAVMLARSRAIGNLAPEAKISNQLRTDITAIKDWDELFGDGSIQHLSLSVDDVNQAFIQSGNQKAINRPADGPQDDIFIDLHTALVSQPSIGLSLLGEREYKNLTDRLSDGQHAFMIMASGRYSYRGSGFVRGGIFDRFQVIQGLKSWLFKDKAYKNLGQVPGGGPDFDEVGLFVLPDDGSFEPTQPWRIQLLIQRPVGAIEKAFVTRSLEYIIPPAYLERKITENDSFLPQIEGVPEISPIAISIWENKKTDVIILLLALFTLTVIFYSQIWIAKRPALLRIIRVSFLLFTLFWLGFYNNAQLSVVNIFTFFGSFISGFNWDYFMMDPLLFILWFTVAASLVLWGRGVFCGWLCPFGALQELVNIIAKSLAIPQLRVPWVIHELLLSLKYVIFIILFGLSLYSFALAEMMAEIEPFKTTIILKLAREWPFTLYAVTLLSLGAIIERFYCRYLCPLGAALAIPARLRTNDWLKRYKECGHPCQRCANECMVQAIMPDGAIHPNECLSCMHCQELFTCDQRCPVMISKRERRERRLGLTSEAPKK